MFAQTKQGRNVFEDRGSKLIKMMLVQMKKPKKVADGFGREVDRRKKTSTTTGVTRKGLSTKVP